MDDHYSYCPRRWRWWRSWWWWWWWLMPSMQEWFRLTGFPVFQHNTSQVARARTTSACISCTQTEVQHFGDDGMVNGFGEGTMGLDGMTKSFDGSRAFAKQFICSEQTFRYNMHKRINASARKRRGYTTWVLTKMCCKSILAQLCITCFHHNWNQIPITCFTLEAYS